ncbi:MAG: L-rhamnose/proton symporter RhaT [Armatimonadota bacterium]
MTALIGVLIVAIAGLSMGSGAWPMKLMRKFQFEHWWLIGMLTGLVIIPWTVTLAFCPHALTAYGEVPVKTLLLSNLFAMGWGIANVLCGLCFVRIGFALTGAILTGLGVSLGVTIPMVVKGSGLFSDAANLSSPAGNAVMAGVAVMLLGVVLVAFAGFGRDRALQKQEKKSGSFLGGLIMASLAGVLSCGISFAFVYGQGPIIAAMKTHGAADTPANFAVWAIGLLGGALVNILYPVYLITKKQSWNVLTGSIKEIGLAAIIGVQFCAAVALMGKGMLILGALGASVGFGIQQASQMLGGQGVGFISGEWRGVYGTPRKQMYGAIAVLIAAALIMAYGNTLAKS